ncbi:MAG: methionine--tRNA ligase [Ruminococcaceae bacterium]|nr:methionine--tRNA ligase [Oscillospiraceae bacterium]
MKDKFYITTAIAYTSQKPHIGNTYEVVFTDAIARFNRLIGKDVFFLTGTDEHGIKIAEHAQKAGVDPKTYVDKIAGEVKNIWDMCGATYDKFIRTTDAEHERAVSEIFKKLYDQGDIYKGKYEGWYCTPCETFYTESQLVDGKCPDCGREVNKAHEEAYFFKMSKYQKQLEEYIENNPDFIAPEARKKEMINNFIKPGIQDLCVSRTTFTWGIPVEFDPGHVIYVWIDALSNYITALGYSTDDSKKGDLFKKYWPADVHIIGKDILRFHTIIWPIILMALGEKLPSRVFGHPWFLSGIDKMSKSKGNTIYADELISYFGVDAVRYYLISQMPYVQDGSITYENVVKVFNADLANTFGNLVSRTVAMNKKYFDSVVPEPVSHEDIDDELVSLSESTVKDFYEKLKDFRTAEALESVMTLLKRANKYIDETMPWALSKDESMRPRLATVIYNLLETIRISTTLLSCAIPNSAQKIMGVFNGVPFDWESIQTFGKLKAGTVIGDLEILFQRIDEEKMLTKIFEDNQKKAKVAEKKEVQNKESEKTEAGIITIDDFMKVSLKAAEILSCEPVEKSDKLLKLIVDMGEERQIVSGIAKFYTPDELVGKKVAVVANLKPVKLRGVDSNGMILASSGSDGKIRVLFLDPETENGAEIR